MAFAPTTAFKDAFTNRVVNVAGANALGYLMGNRSGEATVRSNRRYRVANPEVTVTKGSRNRDGSTGALADITTLSDDSGSLTWLNIDVLDNQHFKTQIDQRDVNYMSPITLDAIQAEMTREATTWLDDRVWQFVKASVLSADTEANADTNCTIDRNTGKVTGGNANQKQSYREVVFDWINDLQLALAMKSFRPALGTRDILDVAVVLTPAMHRMLQDFLLNEYKNTDQIVIEQLTGEAALFGGFYQGTLKGVPIFTTTSTELTAQDDTATKAGELFRAFAFIPGNTWDNAVAAYPMGHSEPSGDSAKFKFQQELELWAGVVNPESRGLFRQLTMKASE